MYDNNFLWKNILKRNFNLPHQNEIFEIIEENLERIVFVKDHIGARDILFIAEEGTQKGFLTNLFISLDVEVKKENSFTENEKEFQKKYEDVPEVVIKNLKGFFAKTKRKLCIGIGFYESMTTQTDEIVITYALREGKIKDVLEGLRKVRRFPSWFAESAIMPEDVIDEKAEKEERFAYQTKIKLSKMVKDEINEILSKKSSDEEDVKRFNNLTKIYNEIKK
jgi:hypothetical protein